MKGCPKCSSPMPLRKAYVGELECWSYSRCGIRTEHLHLICDACGYWLATSCDDAIGLPREEGRDG